VVSRISPSSRVEAICRPMATLCPITAFISSLGVSLEGWFFNSPKMLKSAEQIQQAATKIRSVY